MLGTLLCNPASCLHELPKLQGHSLPVAAAAVYFLCLEFIWVCPLQQHHTSRVRCCALPESAGTICVCSLQGHGAAVTCLTGLHLQEEQQLLLISTGGDACTQVRHASLRRQEAASSEQQLGLLTAWELAQQIRTGLHMQLAAAVARLPDEPEW